MSPRRSFETMGWFVAPIALVAVGVGLWLALRRPLVLFWCLLAGLVLVPVGWTLVSALWPGKAERNCPACRKDALARMDSSSTVGIRCTACGWRDESASAWLLAEEEGPLEEVVLAQRGRKRARRGVDSSGPAG
jgi:Zn ribbon nucleic-acid-binding protein